MTAAECEPTFHLFEITHPAQVEATREALHPEIKAKVGQKPLRVVGLVITTVVKGKPVLLCAGGYGVWAHTPEESKDIFGDLAFPCSLSWRHTPDFIRAEYADVLVDEGGLSEEKNHWVEVKEGGGVAVIPW